MALLLSILNLYLQRKDRRPQLKIRVRYEYRAAPPTATDRETEPLRIHDDSQEGLYLLLGDFLREHGLTYPQGSPVVRFAISNAGQRTVYIDSVRLALHTGGTRFGEQLVFDPSEERLIPADLAKDQTNIVLSGKRTRRRHPLELVPGDAIGYSFELIRLANTLKAAGHLGNVRMRLEVSDRLGKIHRCQFGVDTDLWAYSEEQDISST